MSKFGFDTLIRTIESDDEVDNFEVEVSDDETPVAKQELKKKEKKETRDEKMLKQHVVGSKTFFAEIDAATAEEEVNNITINLKNESLRNRIQRRAEMLKSRSAINAEDVVEEKLDEEKIKNQVKQELLKKRNAKFGVDSDDSEDDEFSRPPVDSDEEYQEKMLITKRIDAEKKRLVAKSQELVNNNFDEINEKWGNLDNSGLNEDDDEEALDEKLNEDIFASQTTITTSDFSGENSLTIVPYNRDFADLHLSRPIIQAIKMLQFDKPTPIQTAAIPIALAGHDLLANAATGSGKTAAFLIPIIERILHQTHRVQAIRAVIVSPTRELAEQIYKLAIQLTKYTDLRCACVVGGLSRDNQELELRTCPDIIICTPGRLIDHLANSKSFDIDDVQMLVLDEADRLLEMGFIDEIREIVKSCPRSRQTMLFSATLNDEVKEIIHLSLKQPKKISVDKNTNIVDTLTQEFVRLRQDSDLIRQSIVLALCKRTFTSRVIVFCKTKLDAHRLLILFGLCNLNAAELHGNLSQAQRSEALQMFKSHKVDYLICTDIAARGIDIKGVQTVINMHMPRELAQYIHRVGRTARAGNKGRSVSIASEEERRLLRDIMKSAKNVVKKREVPAEVLSLYTQKVSGLQNEIDNVLKDEKLDKDIQNAERDLQKAENFAKHHNEIMARPKREWFQSQSEKQDIKKTTAELYKNAVGDTEMQIAELKKVSAEAQEQTTHAKMVQGIEKDPLQGLSRAKKRRKIMQMESKKVVVAAQKEIAQYETALHNKNDDNTNPQVSEKELAKKKKMVEMLLHPEKSIKAAKRKAKREEKHEELQNLEDGAGPENFARLAKKQKREYFENLGKKRKNDGRSKSSMDVANIRFSDSNDNAGSFENSRFAEASRKYNESIKRQKDIETQSRRPSNGAGFKSQNRYKRR